MFGVGSGETICEVAMVISCNSSLHVFEFVDRFRLPKLRNHPVQRVTHKLQYISMGFPFTVILFGVLECAVGVYRHLVFFGICSCSSMRWLIQIYSLGNPIWR